MRKLSLYSAVSLNGYIARKDGDVAWLDTIPNPEKLDFGYYDFYAGIDTTIQGFATYQQIIDWNIPFPYAGKRNYVLTRKQGLEDTEHVQFISERHVERIKALKQEEGKGIKLE